MKSIDSTFHGVVAGMTDQQWAAVVAIVLAERESCAQEADKYKRDYLTPMFVNSDAGQIAADIRNRPLPSLERA